jgi:hypothetical protein
MRAYLHYPVFRDRPIAALAVICLSAFVISVDATIVNVALPTLSRELDPDCRLRLAAANAAGARDYAGCWDDAGTEPVCSSAIKSCRG